MSIQSLFAAILALSLCACGTVEHRQAYQSIGAIEVIEGNFVESTFDSEIVLNETPSQSLAGMGSVTGA